MRPHHPLQRVQPFTQKNLLGGRLKDALGTHNEALPPQGNDGIPCTTPHLPLVIMNLKKIIQVMHQQNVGRQYVLDHLRQRVLADKGTILPPEWQPSQSNHPPTGSRTHAKNGVWRLRGHKAPKGIL